MEVELVEAYVFKSIRTSTSFYMHTQNKRPLSLSKRPFIQKSNSTKRKPPVKYVPQD